MFQPVNCTFIPWCQQPVPKHDHYKAHDIRQVKYYQLTLSKEDLYQFLFSKKIHLFTIALLCSKSADLTLLWKGVVDVWGFNSFSSTHLPNHNVNIIKIECFTWFCYIFNYIFKSYSKGGLLKYVQWANSMISIVIRKYFLLL